MFRGRLVRERDDILVFGGATSSTHLVMRTARGRSISVRLLRAVRPEGLIYEDRRRRRAIGS